MQKLTTSLGRALAPLAAAHFNLWLFAVYHPLSPNSFLPVQSLSMDKLYTQRTLYFQLKENETIRMCDALLHVQLYSCK